MNYNKVIIAGRLTRDMELKYAPSGTAIGQLSLAVNRSWKTDTGEKKEECVFVDCTAFGKTAETISKFFHKGASILIDGRLKQDNWEDKQTHQKRSKLGVVVESFAFVDGKSDGAGSSEAPTRTAPPVAGSKPAPEKEDDGDSVPF